MFFRNGRFVLFYSWYANTLLQYFSTQLLFRSVVMDTLSKLIVKEEFYCRVIDKFIIALKKSGGSHPPGKYMFLEYPWNIPIRYTQYIRINCLMKFQGILRNNVRGILNTEIFPDCSMNFLWTLHTFL